MSEEDKKGVPEKEPVPAMVDFSDRGGGDDAPEASPEHPFTGLQNPQMPVFPDFHFVTTVEVKLATSDLATATRLLQVFESDKDEFRRMTGEELTLEALVTYATKYGLKSILSMLAMLENYRQIAEKIVPKKPKTPA